MASISFAHPLHAMFSSDAKMIPRSEIMHTRHHLYRSFISPVAYVMNEFRRSELALAGLDAMSINTLTIEYNTDSAIPCLS